MFPMLQVMRRRASGILVILALSSAFAATAGTGGGSGQESGDTSTTSSTTGQSNSDPTPFQLVRTDSPREALKALLWLAGELEHALLSYQQNQTRASAERVYQLGPQFLDLLDLTSVPKASRRVVGEQAAASLLDIIGRVDLPPMERIPDADAFEDELPEAWRIPDTPITIARMKDGPRAGEFLFSERSVSVAHEFYQRIRHLPLRSSLGFESWNSLLPQMHGTLIPAQLVAALPDSLKRTWLDTPIWKILTVVILAALATLSVVLLHRAFRLRESENKVAVGLTRALTPLAIMALVILLRFFISFHVNVIGMFAQGVDYALTLMTYLAAAWIFWLFVLTLAEWIIRSPRIADGSLDSDLLRLGARVIGFAGGVLILVHAADALGLPVLGLLAGLGVGGLAVGLAIRPTLENLIGGVILYMDRPVRVGDFCGFGSHQGHVERIGVRSTLIRALDRTLISVPNAKFADMEIVNWGKCDKMLILTTIGLRYETELDQLRYVLVKLREMFCAHPKIDQDTARVRFTGHGASSLDVEVRVYALTRDWNEFYAIREDVSLRMNEIVRESGTGFAFPSRTLYVGRDEGLNEELSDAAVQHVRSLRESGELPFPAMTSSKIESLSSTLDYPPRGSPHAATLKTPAAKAAELLSTEPQDEESDNEKQESETERHKRK